MDFKVKVQRILNNTKIIYQKLKKVFLYKFKISI